MNLFAPLFAAGDVEVLIKVAVLVLFIVVPAIGQLLAKARQVRPPGGGPNPPAPPRPVPQDMADEISEFLRRAAERRRAAGGQPVSAPKPPPVVEQQPAPTALAPLSEAPVRAELATPTPVGGQVSEHVSKYLDEQDFRQREDELGKEVAQVDKEIGQHLQQVFDHRMSKLEAVPGEAAAPPAASDTAEAVGAGVETPQTFATGLLDMVSDPDSLRQVIVLNEILHRPEERWG